MFSILEHILYREAKLYGIYNKIDVVSLLLSPYTDNLTTIWKHKPSQIDP